MSLDFIKNRKVSVSLRLDSGIAKSMYKKRNILALLTIV